MYGTIDKKSGDEPTTDHQSGGTLDASSSAAPGQLEAKNRLLIEQAAETRRRKRIYSHCHIQSADDQEAGGCGAPDNRAADQNARRRLIAASVICLVFMIGEVVGGVLSNSLAIATDAAHLLTDFASFMISLFAIWLSSRPATRKMSFGWYRAEVIGALLSVLMIWLVTGLLVYMAIERLRTGVIEIDSLVMVITASAGLLVNIIMAIALNVDGHGHGHFHSHGGHSHSHSHSHSHEHEIGNHSHLDHVDEDGQELSENELEGDTMDSHSVAIDCSMKESLMLAQQATNGSDKQQATNKLQASKVIQTNKSRRQLKGKRQCQGPAAIDQQKGRGKSNINVRAAFIHVIGDFLQSLGVLIAALVIHFEPSYAIVDPICTFLFSFIVLVTTINIIRDATNVLMEGIPDGINFIEVREKLQSLPNVIRVHNLRIWSLSLDKIAISTHLVIDTSRTTSSQALKRAIDTLKSSYNFFEVTIQIEEYREDMKDCEHCQDEEVVINVPGEGVDLGTTSNTSTSPPNGPAAMA